VGSAIRACCRPYDTACRFGGDEFAVVYAQAEGMDARRAVVRVLEAIREISVTTDGGPVRIRCSAGLACTKGSRDPFTPGDLVKTADEALYEAKRGGRDRLVVRTRER